MYSFTDALNGENLTMRPENTAGVVRAVLSNALLSIPQKTVHLEGLRQHQLRLFRYFGVDADRIEHRPEHPPLLDDDFAPASEVA